MQLALRFDSSQLEFFASRLPQKLGYASQQALWETTLRVQQAVFQRTRDAMTIRNQRLFFGAGLRGGGGVAGRITHFPSYSKNELWSELEAGALSEKAAGIEGNRRLLFSLFETGGMRTPFTPGAKSVAEPVLGGARPSRPATIPSTLTFAGMRLEAFYKNPGSKVPMARIVRSNRHRKAQGLGLLGEFGRASLPSHEQGISWKGRGGTFIMFSKRHPLGMVMQRTGSGRGPESRRELWAFDPPFALHADLRWLSTAETVAQQFFRDAVDHAVSDVLAHEMSRAVA